MQEAITLDLFGESTELCSCPHPQLTKFAQVFYCLKCGSFQPKDGQSSIKQQRMRFPAFVDPVQLLTSQWKKSFKYTISQAPLEYLSQRSFLIDTMMEWAEKLKISLNSLFLGVQFLDLYVLRKGLDFTQLKLYAATALMLAAKSVELDERIPFISKLKRYTYLPYLTSDFRRTECYLIHEIGWDLQYTTLLDWVEGIQSFGFVFDGDELERDVLREKNTNYYTSKIQQSEKQNTFDQLQSLLHQVSLKEDFECSSLRKNTLRHAPAFKIGELFQRIDRSTKSLCCLILKDGKLLDLDPKTLTMSVITYIRKLVGIKQGISKELQSLFPAHLIDLSESFSQPLINSQVSILSPSTPQGLKQQVVYQPINYGSIQRSYTTTEVDYATSQIRNVANVNRFMANIYQ